MESNDLHKKEQLLLSTHIGYQARNIKNSNTTNVQVLKIIMQEEAVWKPEEVWKEDLFPGENF